MPGRSSPSVPVLWNTADWACAVAQLEVSGALPSRTVIVPRERVAHALRRELLRSGRAGALAGTRFVDLVTAAGAVLEVAGVDFSGTEGGLRRARLRELFQQPPKLQYFDAKQLQLSPGWDEAFARTIGELEAAGAAPATLKKGVSPQLDDVAAIWAELDRSAGNSWTSARVLLEAAALLAKSPTLWPFDGAVLMAVGGDETAAAARLVQTIPGRSLAVLAARPLRADSVGRLEALFGAAAAAAAVAAVPRAATGSELGLLARYLFVDPALAADPARPVSIGPDGTVQLEEHAGVESELEAAASWVASEVLERGTPLEEIAILLPALHPLAGLLADRLGRLDGPAGALPVFVAGGLPVTSTATGARLLGLLRTLRANLSAQTLAELLPSLTSGGKQTHLSRDASLGVLYALGTAGGTPAEPAAALEWRTRLDGRAEEIRAQLEKLLKAEKAGEEEADPFERRHLEWTLEAIGDIRPALLALVEVVELLQRGAALGVLWPALHGFCVQWLRMPGDGAQTLAQLDESLRELSLQPLGSKLSGSSALDVIEGELSSSRVATCRFGNPAVYVGTVRDAVGLPFRAVRVMGLSEGSLPSLAREDPVLSTDSKAALLGAGFLGPADRMLSQLQGFHRVLANTQARVVLSAARVDLEGTSKEPSSVFIEAAVALRRPDAVTGQAAAPVPHLASLRRDYLAPGRTESTRFRRATPVGASAWLERVAQVRGQLPPSWLARPELDLARMALLEAEEGGPMDGILGPGGEGAVLRGLTAEFPISASRLKVLLECPQRFFYENVMGWGAPAGRPSQLEIDPMPFGSLVHRTAELFFLAHGPDFSARKGKLEGWLAKGEVVCQAQFAEFLQQSTLLGQSVREQQLDRLQRHLASFLEYDWNGGVARTFVGVERGFGYDAPLKLEVGDGGLFVHGYIDRLDTEGGKTLVRDLKTGKSHSRQADEVDPLLDVQLALYGMVVAQLAKDWKVPKKVAAAYVYTLAEEPERAFRSDFPQLEETARGWLEVGVALLTERAFPRTTEPSDCTYCSFKPVCGDGAAGRSAQLLKSADDGAAKAFGSLRMGEAE